MLPSIEMVEENLKKSIDKALSIGTFSVKIWPEKDLSSVFKFQLCEKI